MACWRPAVRLRYPPRGVSSVGRAPESHSGGQRFDSATLHEGRGAGVVERARLEIVYPAQSGIGGSNPPLSASRIRADQAPKLSGRAACESNYRRAVG